MHYLLNYDIFFNIKLIILSCNNDLYSNVNCKTKIYFKDWDKYLYVQN